MPLYFFEDIEHTSVVRIFRNDLPILDFNDENKCFKDYHWLTLGKRSYFAGTNIAYASPINILCGHYSSIADSTTFNINLDHDYNTVSTYPWYWLNLSDEFGWKTETDGSKYMTNSKRQIIVGNDVWIGRGATIMNGVHIGNGAIVAANSMVTKDVDPYTIVGGNPAKPLRKRFSDEICHKLNIIKWWNWPEEKIAAVAKLMREPEKFVGKFYEPIDRQESKARDWFRKQRGEGGKLFLALVDESLSYPDYPHILEEYKRVRKTYDFLLFLGYGEPSELSKKQDETWGILYNADAVAMSLLQEADWFIVDKNPNCLLYVDYAQIFNTGILFGMDRFIFERAGR